MYLTELSLENFRNYQNESFKFNKGLNIIIGDNGQGKTNIVESIYILSIGKSYRPIAKDKDIISFNKDKSHIRANLKRDNRDIKIDIYMSKAEKKKATVNGVSLKKIGELLGNVNTVIFAPEDLKLVKEGPSERRKFIDILISQLRPQYFYYLSQYVKILSQRNTLLKEYKNKSNIEKTLVIWDEQLIEAGSRIIETRKNFIDKLDVICKNTHKLITEGRENVSLVYQPSFKIKDFDRKNIKDEFYHNLNRRREMDILRATTSIGPHRDDINIFINNSDIRLFGSQGQQRTSVLSLKLSEVELVKLELGEYPILLLDDVMSELDSKRQIMLLQSLSNIQTIITTTDISNIQDQYIKDSHIFEIDNGKIKNQRQINL